VPLLRIKSLLTIIPLISEKVMLLIKPKIAKIVDKCMQPHLEAIQLNKDAVILQEIKNTSLVYQDVA
jgi:hypothetical protein